MLGRSRRARRQTGGRHGSDSSSGTNALAKQVASHDGLAADTDSTRPSSALLGGLTPDDAGNAQQVPSPAGEAAKLLRTLATQLARTLHADVVSFYVYDEGLLRTELAVHGGPASGEGSGLSSLSLPPHEVPAEAEVLRTGQPLHLVSAADHRRWPPVTPELRELAEQGQLVRLVVPLRWDRRTIGVAYLRRVRRPIPFSEEEIRLARELCALATAIVLVNRREGAELRDRRLLATLLDVSQAVARLSDLDQILSVVVETVRRTVGTDAATIFLYDDPGEQTAAFYQAGLTPYEEQVARSAASYSPLEIPVERRVLESRSPVVIPASEFAHQMLPLENDAFLPTEREVPAVLVVPLVNDSRVVGVCYTWSHDPAHRFDSRAIDTAVAVLQVAAGAVMRARLQRRVDRHLEELQALWEVARTAAASQTLDEALDQIVGVLGRFIQFDSAIVAVPDESRPGFLVARWAWGQVSPSGIGRVVTVEGSLVGYVFRTGSGVNVPDTAGDPRAHHAPDSPFTVRSVLIEPLVREGQPVAVFLIGRANGPPFTREEEHLFAVLAQEASTAIALIRAREALQRREREQALLAEVGEALLAARDPVEMIEAVARCAVGIAGEAVGVSIHRQAPSQVEAYAVEHVDPVRCQHLHSLLQRRRSPALVEWLAQEETRVIRRVEVEQQLGEVASRLVALMDAAGVEVVLVRTWRVEGRSRGLLLAGLARADSERIASAGALLREIGERLGIAVERWETAHAREALLRVAREFAQHAELPELVQTIVRELATVLPHDRFIFFEADERARVLRAILSSEPYRQAYGEIWSVPYGRGLSGAVAETRRPELVSDARADARVMFSPLEDLSVTTSLMAAPLVVQNQLLGVLLVGRLGAGRFSDQEFQTFQLFASQAAVACWQAQQRERERALYRASVEALAVTVDARDPYTYNHSRNVARYARLLAEAMGLSPEEVEQVELAGLLHDIGKVGVPDRILRKPGELTADEWKLMRRHSWLGAQILATHPELQSVVPLVRSHHERWDGQGYPAGLEGDEIPLGAAIIGLADAFDTMTSDRPYRRAMPVSQAVEELERGSGTQFHPQVVAAFKRLLAKSPELAGLMASTTLQRCLTVEVSESTVLRELDERVGLVADFTALAEVIDLTLSGSLGTSDLGVMLLDEETGELVVHYSRWYPHLNGQLRLRPGQGASWEVMASGQPLVIREPEKHPKLLRLGPRPFSTAILAPILAEGRPIGTLAISRVELVDPDTDERDARILAAIGCQVGPLLRLLAQATRPGPDRYTAPLGQPQHLRRDETEQDEQRDDDGLVDEVKHQRVAAEPGEQPRRKPRRPVRQTPQRSPVRVQQVAGSDAPEYHAEPGE